MKKREKIFGKVIKQYDNIIEVEISDDHSHLFDLEDADVSIEFECWDAMDM